MNTKSYIKIANADMASEGMGGIKLAKPLQRPAKALPKPRFLPYLTKKPSTVQDELLRAPEPSRTLSNFVQVVSSGATAPRTTTATTTTKMQTAPPILQLPLEIWHIIALDLPQSALATLMLCHSSLHDLTPLLYEAITLVTSLRSRARVIKAQYLFIQRLLSQPHLALYVKRFSWTLDKTDLLPPSVHEKEAVWKDEELYEVFGMLTEVVQVQIGGAGMRGYEPLPKRIAERGFFPKARYVHLSGVMNKEFVDAILLGRVHTENDEEQKGREKEEIVEMAPLKGLSLDDLQEGQSAISTLYRPMQHILTQALFDRCRSLNQLWIRVYGMSERGTRDDELWAEWARFIEEVKPREVDFDCDRLMMRHGRGGGSALRFARLREQRSRAAVANDRRLGETLLPVLKRGWDGLEKIEIRGVGENIVQELQELGERGVQVIFDEGKGVGYRPSWDV